ncbi:DNA-binding barrel domain superfamily, partial [Sesbania bispinosa]
VVLVNVVLDFLVIKQPHMQIMLPDGNVKFWTLKWNNRRKYNVHLGFGWYGFARTWNLQVGDYVRFWKMEGQYVVTVRIN